MKNNLFFKIVLGLILVSITLTLFGCSSFSAKNDDLNESYLYSANDTDSADAYIQSFATTSNGFENKNTYQSVAPEKEKQVSDDFLSNLNSRKIIYSSWFNISTENFDETIASLDSLCKTYGAYYENSETYGSQNEYSNRRAHFIVRIPQENYKIFINQTGAIGTVTSSGENNNDITENYYDTEARLESAKIREQRLLEILEKSDNLNDVLLLEKELSDVIYEIENYSGTLKKYDSLINYSTATINIEEVIKILPPDTEKRTLSSRLKTSLERGFDNFTNSFSNMLIDLTYALPVFLFIWLPIIIIFVIAFFLAKRKIKKRKEKKMAKEDIIVENEIHKN